MRDDDVRTVGVWRALDEVLGAPPLVVVDAGGGTGTFAVPIAERGHSVTVVDPSPDALATLARRADAAGVGDHLAGVQGDLADLARLVPDGADVVLCHNVLEQVADPVAGLRDLAGVLRPGGVASILVAGRGGGVLALTFAGRYADARALLAGGGEAPRRFTATQVHDWCTAAGLTPSPARAGRVFADVAPREVEADADASAALAALELAVTADADFLGIAAQIHVLARK